MFIYSVNGKKIKIIACCIIVLIFAVICYMFVNRTEPYSVQSGKMTVNTKISNEKDVKKFLEQYGWQVDEDPTQVSTVRIPSVFNDVYTDYNTLQMSQGFDLTEYMGKVCTKYSFNVLNYPGDGENITATVIVCEDKVIAGDISDPAYKGFMKGLSFER